MLTEISDAEQLLAFVADCGATAPAELSRPIVMMHAIRASRRRQRDSGGVAGLLTALVRGTEDLTDDQLEALLKASAQSITADDATSELIEQSGPVLLGEFKRSLLGEPGDSLAASLRTAEFDRLVDELQAHSANLPAGITAEEVVELDEAAIESWRAVPAVTERLSRYVTSYATPLIHRFGIATGGNRLGPVPFATRMLAFLIDPDAPMDLHRAGRAWQEYVSGSTSPYFGERRSRFGPFQGILGSLRLNSPREAEGLLSRSDDVFDLLTQQAAETRDQLETTS